MDEILKRTHFVFAASCGNNCAHGSFALLWVLPTSEENYPQDERHCVQVLIQCRTHWEWCVEILTIDQQIMQ